MKDWKTIFTTFWGSTQQSEPCSPFLRLHIFSKDIELLIYSGSLFTNTLLMALVKVCPLESSGLQNMFFHPAHFFSASLFLLMISARAIFTLLFFSLLTLTFYRSLKATLAASLPYHLESLL